MSFAWSPAALDELYRLYVQERRSASQTAAVLGGGVTRNAVLGKVQRLGWVRPPAEPKPVAASKPQAAARRERPRAGRRPARPRNPFAGRIPLPRLREAAVVATARPWTERRAGECAFPVGEPDQPGRQLSCCAPVQGRGAYCAAHRGLMIVKGSRLTPKDEDAIVEIARRAA